MESKARTKLRGWKAIAAYLQRDERTAMRWAAQREMPVHRVPGEGRASVYALADELDRWLLSGARGAEPASGPAPPIEPAAASPPAGPPPSSIASPPIRRRWWTAAAGLGALATVAVAAVVLPITSRPRLAAAPARADPVTRELLLDATYDWNRRTQDSLARAVSEYSAAIGRDPRIPEAFVGLANSYLLLREYGSVTDAQAYPRAEAAARAAVALAPESAATHRLLGFLAFWWHGDRAEARREFARSLALAPGDPLTHHWFANALAANGEYQAALREINLARDLDPTSISVLSDAGTINYLAGDRRQGLSMLEAQARDQPQDVTPHRALADIALFEGRTAQYVAEAMMAERLRGDAAGLRAAERLAEVSGARDAAPLLRQMLTDARSAAGRSDGGFYRLARVASLSGHGPDADAALARACDGRETGAVGANGDLWLSRSLSPDRIRQLCGHRSLL